MRALWLGVLSISASLGCAPVPGAEDAEDAADAADDERPCRTQEDCEIASADTGPRTQLCTSRAIRLDSPKDIAACGPMPNMTPAISEPRLACFRGTCVPIPSR